VLNLRVLMKAGLILMAGRGVRVSSKVIQSLATQRLTVQDTQVVFQHMVWQMSYTPVSGIMNCNQSSSRAVPLQLVRLCTLGCVAPSEQQCLPLLFDAPHTGEKLALQTHSSQLQPKNAYSSYPYACHKPRWASPGVARPVTTYE
jgi:hypothetical protein